MNRHFFTRLRPTMKVPKDQKRCSLCGQVKNVLEFGVHRCEKDGLRCSCKSCVREFTKKYRALHLEEMRRIARNHYNKEKAVARWDKYHKGNKEKIITHKRRRYKENIVHLQESARKYYHEHREQCAVSSRRYRENNKEYLNDRGRERRALQARVTIEKFPSLEIFERDGWICQICKKKVNRCLKAPNPLSKSLDHIIPISRGGSHSRINVQLVHLVCNEKAHVGGIKQLRLMG